MKDIKKNITVILIIFISLFTILAGYLIYDVVLYSGRWISSAYNPRLKEQRTSVIPGSIYDVNGLELAGSSYSNRTYIDNENIRLSSSHLIGDVYGFSPSGVETTQGAWLLGLNENLIDRIMRVLVSETAHGSDIILTVDASINAEIAELLNGLDGSAVVINYKTGEILSMVSLPEFDLKEIDLNLPHGGADEESLVNRALQSVYPMGSAFNVVTIASAMENLEIANKSFTCDGSISTDEGKVFCALPHNEQLFEELIINDCKSQIAQLGVDLEYKQLLNTAKQLGFNYQFLFSDLVLYESIVNLNSLSTDFDVANISIGAYDASATPMHMAMIYGAIANEGKINPLKLLKDIEGIDISKRNEVLRKSFDYAVAHKLNDVLQESDPIVIDDTKLCIITSDVKSDSEFYDKVSICVGYSYNENYPYSFAIVIEDYNKKALFLREYAKTMFDIIMEND